VQRSQPMIARARRRLSFRLQVIQKCFHQGNIDQFEPQLFRSDAPHVTAESEKQRKHVAVGLNGIGTEIPLRGQVMRQETSITVL